MKVLTLEGLKTLWSQVSLKDYPNNETLVAVIEAIDETKADRNELKNYLKIEDYVAGGTDIDLSFFAKTVYPVGSIYISVSNVNPSTLFGFGEWEQIQDRFLLGAGSTYTGGSVGGEATHTLTAEEIPAHSHTFNRHKLWSSESVPESGTSDGYGASNKTLRVYMDNTSVVGGGQAHNNMPPYLTVYMWKRVS